MKRRVTYTDCMGIAARIWCDPAYEQHNMDEEAAMRIADILFVAAKEQYDNIDSIQRKMLDTYNISYKESPNEETN